MDGFLLVDKPAGWTSHDVVAKVRANIREAQKQEPWPVDGEAMQGAGEQRTEVYEQYSEGAVQWATPQSTLSSSGAVGFADRQAGAMRRSKVKIGHTGTLDPAATGLMILVLGSYTKRAAQFSKMDKIYSVEATLGQVSSTGDKEGELIKKNSKIPSQQEIEAALHKFQGEIMQLPPIYSAIKIGGQRAYKLAREGKPVVLEPRLVHIKSIKEVSYDYPALSFKADVGSGTYIRSLVEDIGNELETGAYMSNLRRLSVGGYTLKDAIAIDNLSISDIINNVKQIPPK